MKRQIKQTLAKVLVVCMILSMLPVSAFAATETLSEQTNGIKWLGENGEYYVKGDVTLSEPYYITGDANAKITYAINVDTQHKLTMDTIYVENVDTLTVGGYIYYATTSDTATFQLYGSGLVLSPVAAKANVTIEPYSPIATKGIRLMSAVDDPKIEVSGKYENGLTLTGVKATVGSANVTGTLTVDENANVTVTGTTAAKLTVTNATAELNGKTEVTDTLTVEKGATVTATGTKAGNLTVTGDKSTAKLTDVTVGTKLEVGTGAVVTVASGELAAVDVKGGTLTIGDKEAETKDFVTIKGKITVETGAKLVLGEDVTLDTSTEIEVKNGAKLQIPQKLVTSLGNNLTGDGKDDIDIYDETVKVTVTAEDVDGETVEATFTYTITSDTKVTGEVEDDTVYVTTGDTIELTVAADGYRVKTWRVGTEDKKTTDATYAITVDAKVETEVDVVVVLEKIPTYKVTFEAAENGTYTYKVAGDAKTYEVTDKDVVAEIAAGKTVTLEAKPDKGYELDHWVVNGGTLKGDTYEVKADATITAVFKKLPVSHEVTFKPAENGTYTATYALDEHSDVTVNVEGDVVTKTFDKDTELTLAATPAKGYEFDHWVINEQVVTEDTYMITGDTTITAVFTKIPVEYTVTVDVEPVEGGTVTYTVGTDTTPKAVNGPITFKEGEEVTLKATPADGYEFVEWQIDGKSVGTETTYTVSGDAEITAVFEKIPVTQYKLTVKADPTNGGTLSGSINGSYPAGTTVTVIAKANTGYKFDGWFNAKNEKVSGDAEYSFAITADTELTAKFSKEEEPKPEMVTVEVKATTGGTATVNGETKVEVEAGTEVTLVATAASGYEFVNWTDASGEEVTVGADGKYKADESVVLTANFKAKTPSGPVGPFIPSGPTGPSTPSHVCPAAAYTDVNQNMWYHEAVDYVVEHGYMQGTTATEFAPNANIKRADVALVLYRMQNSPAVEVGATYSDVDAGAYYAAAVAWADANGIVNGYGDGTFKPNKEITREELVAVMSRYAAFLNANVTGSASLARFVDAADVSAYAVAPMQWAVQTAIIQGTSVSTLVPKHTATRAQFAAMIMRLCENVLAK